MGSLGLPLLRTQAHISGFFQSRSRGTPPHRPGFALAVMHSVQPSDASACARGPASRAGTCARAPLSTPVWFGSSAASYEDWRVGEQDERPPKSLPHAIPSFPEWKRRGVRVQGRPRERTRSQRGAGLVAAAPPFLRFSLREPRLGVRAPGRPSPSSVPTPWPCVRASG